MKQDQIKDIMKNFICNCIILKDFCTFLSDRLNKIEIDTGDKYHYPNLNGNDDSDKCDSLLRLAEQENELDYVAFYIVKYYFDNAGKDIRNGAKESDNDKVCCDVKLRLPQEYLDKKMNYSARENRLHKFLSERVAFKNFCFYFVSELNNVSPDSGEKYDYEKLDGNNDIEKSQSLILEVKKKKYDDMDYLVFYILMYWHSKNGGDFSIPLLEGLHLDLCHFYKKLKNRPIPGFDENIKKLMKCFEIKLDRYIEVIVPDAVIKGNVFPVHVNILPCKEKSEGKVYTRGVLYEAQASDGELKFQGKLNVTLMAIPSQCRNNPKSTNNPEVKEQYEKGCCYIDFNLKALTIGDGNLIFLVNQGDTEILREKKTVKIVEPPELELIARKILIRFYLFYQCNKNNRRESREREMELFEIIARQNRESEQKIEQKNQLIYKLEQREKKYLHTIEKLKQETAINRTAEHQIVEWRFVKKLTSILKAVIDQALYGLFNAVTSISGLEIPYTLLSLNYNPEFDLLLYETLKQLPKSRPTRLFHSVAVNESIVVGLDFGTSYSSIAVSQNLPGNLVYSKMDVTLIGDENSEYYIPSALATDEKGIEYFGIKAKEMEDKSSTIIQDSKRFMGEDIRLPFGKSHLLPEDASSKILGYLKNAAETHTGKIDKVIISVPAHFEDSHLYKTKIAAERAEFVSIEFIKDPIAAAKMYYYNDLKEKSIITYDMGGGTFEAALLKQRGKTFEIVAFDWNQHINGTKFDRYLASWIAQQLEKQGIRLDMEPDSVQINKRMRYAEKVKIALSYSETYQSKGENTGILDLSGTPVKANLSIKRADFDFIIEKDIDETINICNRLLSNTKGGVMTPDEILLIGGGAHIPLVSSKLSKVFGCKIRKESPDICVVLGAAIMGRQMNPGFQGHSYKTKGGRL